MGFTVSRKPAYNHHVYTGLMIEETQSFIDASILLEKFKST